MRLVPTVFACAALALPACGGDEGEPIPGSNERQLLALLQQAEDRTRGEPVCGDLLESDEDGAPTLDELQQAVLDLPDSVDQDVRDALEDSVGQLRRLIEDECAADAEPETTPTEPTPPETETQPPETETQPPGTETQPPETQPEPPEMEPDEDGGGQPGPDEEGKKKGKNKAKEAGR